MFDSIHAGDRCTQTKAFGRCLRDFKVGDAVKISASTYLSEDDDDFDIGDGQVNTYGGGWLIVRDGVLVEWASEPVPDLRRYDNSGKRIGNKPVNDVEARLVEPGRCSICAQVRAS